MADFVLPLIGASLTRRTLVPEFELGTPNLADNNASHVYVKASAAINAATVSILTVPAYTVAAGAGAFTADTAFAINEYGFIRRTANALG